MTYNFGTQLLYTAFLYTTFLHNYGTGQLV